MELRSQRKLVHRRDAAERHVRALIVASPKPAGSSYLHLFYIAEEVAGNPRVAHCAVVAFDVRVLLWAAWLDVYQGDALPLRACLQRTTDVLRAVVAADGSGLAAPLNHLLKASDYASSTQRDIDLHRQALSIEVIQDVEQSGAPSISKLVMH